jgi:hypothetical protein
MKDSVGCQEDMVPGWSIRKTEYWSNGEMEKKNKRRQE